MAAEGGGPGQRRIDVLRKLGNISASDAKHDFNGGRGIFTFITLFNKYKGIGTPIQPDSASSEFDIFCETLNLSKPREDSETTFKNFIGLSGGLHNGESTPIQKINFFQDGERPYTIRTICVAEGNEDGRTWFLSPETLYDELNRENRGKELVFTIDAQNCPFYEHFLTPGNKKRKAVCIFSREGVIDGAAKPDKAMDTKEQTEVEIIKLFDTEKENIAYHATDPSRFDTLLPQELFFSKYSFFIPPLRNIEGVLSTSIEFTDSQMSSSSVRYLSSTENKNPYTVSNLSKIITSIIGKSTSFLKSTNREKEYHMSLQFKRAGDWTQTLACLSPERFGLPKDTNIRLVTNDRICLLYAIIMGVDVIFTTYKKTEKKYYLTTFYKQKDEVKPEDLLQEKVNFLTGEFIDPTSLISIKKEELAQDVNNTYLGILPTYIRIREEVHRSLLQTIKGESDAITSYLDAITNKSKRKDDRVGESILHSLLKTYIVLVHFRTFCPPMVNDTKQCIQYLKQLKSGYTEELHARISRYLKQYTLLKEIIIADSTTKGGSKGTHAEKIEHFLKNRFINKKYFPKVIEEKNKIVELLSIAKPRFFSSANDNENGTGIILYIGNLLTKEERGILFASIVQIRGILKDTSRFDIFLKIVAILNEIQGEPLTIQELPTEEILGAMFHETVAAGGGAGAGGAGAAGAGADRASSAQINSEQQELQAAEAALGDEEHAASEVSKKTPKSPAIRVSDFSTEQVILSHRAHRYFNTAIFNSLVQGLDEYENGLNHLQLGGSKSKSKRIYQPYSHNPLTTFCYILIELNNILSTPDYDYYRAHTLSQVMEYVVKVCVKNTSTLEIKKIYAYLYSMEVFLLEGLTSLLPNLGVNHFMVGIKEFYGFSHIKNFKRRIHVPLNLQKEIAAIQPKTMSEQKRIENNSKLFVYILKYIGLLEMKLSEEKVQGTLMKGLTHFFTKTRRNASQSDPRMSKSKSKTRKSNAKDPILI